MVQPWRWVTPWWWRHSSARLGRSVSAVVFPVGHDVVGVAPADGRASQPGKTAARGRVGPGPGAVPGGVANRADRSRSSGSAARDVRASRMASHHRWRRCRGLESVAVERCGPSPSSRDHQGHVDRRRGCGSAARPWRHSSARARASSVDRAGTGRSGLASGRPATGATGASVGLSRASVNDHGGVADQLARRILTVSPTCRHAAGCGPVAAGSRPPSWSARSTSSATAAMPQLEGRARRADSTSSSWLPRRWLGHPRVGSARPNTRRARSSGPPLPERGIDARRGRGAALAGALAPDPARRRAGRWPSASTSWSVDMPEIGVAASRASSTARQWPSTASSAARARSRLHHRRPQLAVRAPRTGPRDRRLAAPIDQIAPARSRGPLRHIRPARTYDRF